MSVGCISAAADGGSIPSAFGETGPSLQKAPLPLGASSFLEYVVYILFSEKLGKTYVGCTSDLINRMRSHNMLSPKGYTVRFRPWKVVHVEFFDSKTEALQREAYLKSGVGRDLILKLLHSIS